MRSDSQGLGWGGSGEPGEVSPAPPCLRLSSMTRENVAKGGIPAAAETGLETADSTVAERSTAAPSPLRERQGDDEAGVVGDHE